jgi:hypothetical protein
MKSYQSWKLKIARRHVDGCFMIHELAVRLRSGNNKISLLALPEVLEEGV